MLTMTWRNLFARKVRLALSAFAIVLGVAFVAGSFVFTDAMGDAFDGIIAGSTSDVEIAYKGANDFNSQPQILVSNLAQTRKIAYLKVNLVGTRSNRNGLGAKVVVTAGKLKSFDGLYGLRFAHNTDVIVTGLTVTR